MGNCLRHNSSSAWANDDWEPSESDRNLSTVGRDIGRRRSERKGRETNIEEAESLLREEKDSSVTSTEVKIKVTKRQLEELLGKIDVQGMSIEDLLTQLVSASADVVVDHDLRPHRSWKPALQSIPEVN